VTINVLTRSAAGQALDEEEIMFDGTASVRH
jgi:hypothetical protein